MFAISKSLKYDPIGVLSDDRNVDEPWRGSSRSLSPGCRKTEMSKDFVAVLLHDAIARFTECNENTILHHACQLPVSLIDLINNVSSLSESKTWQMIKWFFFAYA